MRRGAAFAILQRLPRELFCTTFFGQLGFIDKLKGSFPHLGKSLFVLEKRLFFFYRTGSHKISAGIQNILQHQVANVYGSCESHCIEQGNRFQHF